MPRVTLEQDPSVAAEEARRRLHEEIERVRVGVEEMLTEQGGSSSDAELRRELDEIREQTRRYVKKRVNKAERRLEQRIADIDTKTQALEHRIDQAEQDRKYAEWRLHTNTEKMLDGLLREVRAIADLLTRSSSR